MRGVLWVLQGAAWRGRRRLPWYALPSKRSGSSDARVLFCQLQLLCEQFAGLCSLQQPTCETHAQMNPQLINEWVHSSESCEALVTPIA